MNIYADDLTIFLADEESAEETLCVLRRFHRASGLEINVDKTEAMWLGSYKGRAYKPLGVKWKENLKITGVVFSYDISERAKLNYERIIQNIEQVCNLWKQRNLTLIGKVEIIKTFCISKLVFMFNMTVVPPWVITAANKIIYKYLWNGRGDKIKRNALIAPVSAGGLNLIDLQSLVTSQRVVWLKRYFCAPFHPWKIVMNYNLHKLTGIETLNSNVHQKGLQRISPFYKEILAAWSSYDTNTRHVLDTCLWWNSDITTRSGVPLVPSKDFIALNVNSIIDIYDINTGLPYTWVKLLERNWKPRMFIMWCSILSCIPSSWKRHVNIDTFSKRNIKSVFECVNKKKVYEYFISLKAESPSSQRKLEALYGIDPQDWVDVYLLPFYSTMQSSLRVFQFKLTHNILYCNAQLFAMGITESKYCKRCTVEIESVSHMLYECLCVKSFWEYVYRQYILKLNNNCNINITVTDVLFGVRKQNKNVTALNHVILIAKRYIYECKISEKVIMCQVFDSILEGIIDTERSIASKNNTIMLFEQKWLSILS